MANPKESEQAINRREFNNLLKVGLGFVAFSIPGVAYILNEAYHDNIDRQEPLYPDLDDPICRLRFGETPYNIYRPTSSAHTERLRKIANMDPSNNWFNTTLSLESDTIGDPSLTILTPSTTSPREHATISVMPHTVFELIFRNDTLTAICEGPLPDDSLPLDPNTARLDDNPNRRRIAPLPYLLQITRENFGTTSLSLAIKRGMTGLENIFTHFSHPEISRLEPMRAVAIPPTYHNIFVDHLAGRESDQEAIQLVRGINGKRSSDSQFVEVTIQSSGNKDLIETGTLLEIKKIISINGELFAAVINRDANPTHPKRNLLINPDDLVFPPLQTQEHTSPSELERRFAENNPTPPPTKRPEPPRLPTMSPPTSIPSTNTPFPTSTPLPSPTIPLNPINTLLPPTQEFPYTPTPEISVTKPLSPEDILKRIILGVNLAVWPLAALRKIFEHAPPPPLFTNLRVKSQLNKSTPSKNP